MKKFGNLSLKRKLFLIVTLSIVLLSASGLTGFKIISDAYLRLLEETVADNLASSAAVISGNLSSIESMTESILADSVVQDSLTAFMDKDDPRTQTSSRQTLSYHIQEYYAQHKSSHIDYIALYHARDTIYSNFLSGRRTPEEVENSLLALAEENEGRPVWMFDYAEDGRFYLGREIRDIQNPYFRSLGTLIVSVNVNDIIASLGRRSGAFPDTRYFIAKEEDIIYKSDDTAWEIYPLMDNIPDGQYEILTVNNHKYFVYSTVIPGHHLTYACYLTYDSIFHSATFAVTISLFIVLLTCLTAFVLSQLMIASISRHTNRLVQKMQAYNAADTARDFTYQNREDEFGLLNRQFDSMAERIHNLIQVNYVNELWKKDAQIKALEKQIQPHFLYNTLESINWRAKAAGNYVISDMTESLGSLLRASLSEDNGVWTLQKELEITDAYITIQKYRFEEQLDYASCCEQYLKGARIPKFTIQPLVENAVRYGLEESMDVCRIRVNIRIDGAGELLHIYVQNDGSQFEENLLSRLRSSQAAAKGLGIGLINIDERIKLMFGPAYGLMLYNRREDAIAQITIPCNLH